MHELDFNLVDIKREHKKNHNFLRLDKNENLIFHSDFNSYPDMIYFYNEFEKILGHKIFFTEGVGGAIKNIFECLRPSYVNYDLNDYALFPVFEKIYCKPSGPTIKFILHPDENVVSCSKNYDHVVIDDAYRYFCPMDWDQFLHIENITICRSFSKAYGLAGLRIGYVVGELREYLSKFRGAYEANTFSMATSLEALKNKNIMLDYVSRCKESLNILLQDNSFNYDGFSNSVYSLKINAYNDLIESKIMVKRFNDRLRITLAPFEIIKPCIDILSKH